MLLPGATSSLGFRAVPRKRNRSPRGRKKEAAVVAFISQKDGVGESTLARDLASEAGKSGLEPR